MRGVPKTIFTSFQILSRDSTGKELWLDSGLTWRLIRMRAPGMQVGPSESHFHPFLSYYISMGSRPDPHLWVHEAVSRVCCLYNAAQPLTEVLLEVLSNIVLGREYQ